MLINEVRINCIRRLEPAAVTNSFEKGSFHFIFVHNGSGVLRIDENSHHIQENDCLLFHDFDNLQVTPDQGGSVSLMQIIFKILNVELAKELVKYNEKILTNSQVTRSLVLKIWNDTFMKPPYYEDSVSLSLMNLLLLVIASKDRNTNNPGLSAVSNILCVSPVFDENLNIMLEYIGSHLSEDITIRHLTALVNMAPKQIDRLFKEYYSCTPLQFINNLRLAKSKELLLYSSHNITEIAELTGFKTIHYFSRFFKEKEKVSPLTYKESMGCNRYAI